MATPDPKPPRRVRDPEALARLHRRWRSCALCGSTGRVSLHHIHRHPRDDVESNLIMLCGSGTTGCHGLVEARDLGTLILLVRHIRIFRLDTFLYLTGKLGSETAADEWLRNLTRSVLQGG